MPTTRYRNLQLALVHVCGCSVSACRLIYIPRRLSRAACRLPDAVHHIALQNIIAVPNRARNDRNDEDDENCYR